MELIREYFPELSGSQTDTFAAMQSLYTYWNEKMNLVSRNDLSHLYERHVLFSLAICRLIQFQQGTSLIDVGTGGGFPGIPLAVYFPECQFTLIDSIQKKINAVKNISRELGLTNAEVICTRSESFRGSFHFILGRAVTSLPDFYLQTRHLGNAQNNHPLKNGILYLKGGDVEQETTLLKGKVQSWNINQWFSEDFFSTKKILHTGFF